MKTIRSVKEFLGTEYKSYAEYVLFSRAIPSAIDGFKPTQRKVAHVASNTWKESSEKPLKVFQLCGKVASEAMYFHGDASLSSAIITMTQAFKNSMPIFDGVGQFGSLRSPEAGAPRYVGVKLNSNFRLLYKDDNLLEGQLEEGEAIEPKYFLPIIPTVLLNGGSGIAVGFASNILNRKPSDLINACLDVLAGKQVKTLNPWNREFQGTFSQVLGTQLSWVASGKYTVKNTTTVEVTEIAPSLTYEKYEAHLDSLVEKGVLSSYDDNSSGKVHYVLKFPRKVLETLISKGKLEDTLKIHERDTENLTVLDENKKLKIFTCAEDIVKYFVEFRLGFYQKRKDLLIKNLKEELLVLNNRTRFIQAILSGELIVNAQKKKDVESNLSNMNFAKQDKSFSYLTGMPILTLTQEKIDDLQKQTKQKEDELKKIESASPAQLYKDDLLELRSKIDA